VIGGHLRVIIADDFGPFRALISSIVRKEPTLSVIAEVADGLEAISRVQTLRPELILLDVGLPKLNGLQAARKILDTIRDAKIIFISQESSIEVALQALRLGGLGYVAKARVATDLLPAIEAVLQGRTFLSDGLNGEASLY
jgi:DNA-binding NarL/FixJ family response regulator